MPIRLELRHHYGKAWRATRAAILVRAGDACECSGQCGNDHVDRCRAPHGVTIWRWIGQEWTWSERAESWGRPVRVVLTVAHLNHEAGDDRPDNLLALCQRCHLRLDREQHAATAARTRAAKAAT